MRKSASALAALAALAAPAAPATQQFQLNLNYSRAIAQRSSCDTLMHLRLHWDMDDAVLAYHDCHTSGRRVLASIRGPMIADSHYVLLRREGKGRSCAW